MLIRAWVLVFVFASIQGFAQSVQKDSIESYVKKFPKDSSSVIKLNSIASEFLKTSPAKSREICNYTATLSREIAYPRGYARSLTVIGNSYWYEGMFEFAQNYYLLAAKQYEEINDLTGLGKVYNNIGEVNKGLGMYDVALRYLSKSAELRENDSTLGITLYNIAELYIIQKKFDEATKYLELSMALAKKSNDERSVYYNYWSSAKIKIANGSFSEGISYYNKAAAGWKSLDEQRSLIQTYLDLSEAWRNEGNNNRSSAYVNEIFALLRHNNVPDLKVRAYLELSRLDSAQGNYAGALQHLSRHLLLKDSVYNLLKTEQVARLQVLYEAESREHENEQLRTEKELRESEIKYKEGLLAAIGVSFVILAFFAVVLYRQHRLILRNHKILSLKNDEIKSQKESLELQAVTLMNLNEELNHLNKTLETRIEERSKQVIIQNQKLAEYSFVNAHKLRAPVASILGLIQLMNQAAPEEREEIINHLKLCSEQLDTVIQEIGRNLEM